MATSSPTTVQSEQDQPRKTRSQTEKEKRKSEGVEESGEAQSPSRKASTGKKRGRTPGSDGGTPKSQSKRGSKSKRAKQEEPLSPVAGSPKAKQSTETAQPCSHADEGCEFVGTEKQLDVHLARRPSQRSRQNACKFAQVPCQYCKELVVRKDLETHESSCEHRGGRCEHCKKPYNDYSKHNSTCKSLPVSCPECGTSVLRKNLATHQSHKCENRAVPCVFRIAGCEDKPRVKDMLDHNRERKMDHLQLVQSHLAQNARRIQGRDASRFIELVADCLRHIAEASEDTETIANVEQKLGEIETKHRELWDVVGKQKEDVSTQESTVVEMHQAAVSSQQEEIERCRRECDEVRKEVEELRQMVRAQQEIIDKQQEVISQQKEGGSGDVSDRYQTLIDAQAQEIEGCKKECASIREELAESSAEKVKATAERNRSLLIKHTDMLVKQQADITQQKKGLQDLEGKMSTATLPFEFTMTNVSRWRLTPDPFYSPPFYTHHEGYRMCIRVYPEGVGPAYGNHISVYAYLMRGEYDHKLLWPFQGSVTVQMLNQMVNDNHCIATLNFAETSDPDVVGRVTGGDRAKYGIGVLHFLHQARLDTDQERNTKFLDCNSLHFRVLRTSNVNASAHLLRRCRLLESFMTSVEPQLSIAPIEFTLTDYIQHKKQSGVWVSPAFYSHKGGYRICLEVYPNGMQEAWGQYVSVYTCIVRGPFDSDLKWPFRGTIAVEILNQVRNQDHCKGVIVYSDSTSDHHANRVIRSERSIGNGIPLFISHADLGPDNDRKVLYLHNNTLRIRIGEIVLKN